jgi:hypothetical protein
MNVQRQAKFGKLLQVRVPEVLSDAIEVAAARNLMTPSEYVRRSAIDRLRADGIDPSRLAAA